MAKQTIPGKAPVSLAPVKALSEPKPVAPAVQAAPSRATAAASRPMAVLSRRLSMVRNWSRRTGTGCCGPWHRNRLHR